MSTSCGPISGTSVSVAVVVTVEESTFVESVSRLSVVESSESVTYIARGCVWAMVRA